MPKLYTLTSDRNTKYLNVRYTYETHRAQLGTTLFRTQNQRFGQAMYYLPNTSTVSETKQETRASLLNKMAELLMPKFSAQFNGCNAKSLNLTTHIKHKNTQLGTT